MPQKNYHLHLKGVVGGYDFDSSYVDFILGKHKDEQVNVLIDSLGGSVSTALSIAAAFSNHGNVAVHYVGMNASAATIASLGAKQVTIDCNAMYLVHKCSAEFFKWDNLNADDLDALIAQCKQMKNDLDKLDGNIASMYAGRCKKSSEELLALMKVGGWLTAQEAKEWGFVDEITNSKEDAAPVLTDAVASAMADAGIPIPNIAVPDTANSFLAFLKGLFRNNSNSNTSNNSKPDNKMKITATHLCDALGIESIEAEDNKVTLTAEQAQSIDNALAERENTISTLKAEVETLKQKPADSTSTIVDDKTKGGEKNEAEEFADTVNEAIKLFNSI
ncbi:MAG: Clp protease ClpP [Bacteroidaceae bacterium]|nr:Clp protease ClpP [Bacteroidaceae bacterium]